MGGTAVAQDAPAAPGAPREQPSMDTHGKMGASDKAEPNKHLSEVDLYLKDAMNNTKALYQTTQLPTGKFDTAIQKESLGNIDKAITGALTHIGHVKSLPQARVSDMKDVASLQSDLNQAKTIVAQLRKNVSPSADKTMISSQTAQLYGVLKAADDDFGKIADQTNLTRIDRINVPEKQPVGGTAAPGGEGTEGGGINDKGGTPKPGDSQPPKGNQGNY